MPLERLNVTNRGVDTAGMIDFELEFVRENPDCLTVLRAYQAAQEELAAQQAQAAGEAAQSEKSSTEASDEADSDPEAVVAADISADSTASSEDTDATDDDRPRRKRASRWVPRITSLAGLETEELSRLHGRLIAYDLLKCDLADRSAGMIYQLTSTGKQVIARLDDDAPGDAGDELEAAA